MSERMLWPTFTMHTMLTNNKQQMVGPDDYHFGKGPPLADIFMGKRQLLCWYVSMRILPAAMSPLCFYTFGFLCYTEVVAN